MHIQEISLKDRSTAALREIAGNVSSEYIMVYLNDLVSGFGEYAEERFISVAEDTGADMLYSDHYRMSPGENGVSVRKKYPLIDCQKGALRDDFDFGSAVLFRTSSFREAVADMAEDYKQQRLHIQTLENHTEVRG